MSYNKEFISKESIAGGALIIAAILAMIASNTGLATYYHHFLDINFSVSLNGTGISKPIVLWINDGLMAIFFLLVGLELKREILTGELKEYDKALLPIGGAIGGMFIPALVYYYFAYGNEGITHAWAIPMATDIAFALGILAMFGKRVPLSLKVFLMTLAIIDDLGAIVVIALFHTADLSWFAFIMASVCMLVLIVMNRLRVDQISAYLLVGLIMWVCVLKSGFHATMAGVLLAFTIPMFTKDNKPLLKNFEHDIHPMVAFFIIPVFAFSNAGVPLEGMSLASLQHPLVMAISFGLIVGKIVGIVVCTLLVKKLFNITASFTNGQLVGVAALCGIGFTMSLFIAGLSFGHDEVLLNLSRLGILISSLAAMVIGVVVLYLTLPKSS